MAKQRRNAQAPATEYVGIRVTVEEMAVLDRLVEHERRAFRPHAVSRASVVLALVFKRAESLGLLEDEQGPVERRRSDAPNVKAATKTLRTLRT